MSKNLWNLLLLSPCVLGTTLAVCTGAIASETPDVRLAENKDAIAADNTREFRFAEGKDAIATLNVAESEVNNSPVAELESPASSNTSILDQNNLEIEEDGADDAMGQVTNVTQLRDVRPGDWAYEALRSLVERYNCIAGYPDGTFRGSRAMTRYEFAAGLNACLRQIEKLIAARPDDLASRADLDKIRQLVDQFAPEITTLRGRVDSLEARTSELEATQFSTTTKLDGEVILGFASIVKGEDATGSRIDSTSVFGHRSRLNLETSFTGKDLLRTRLQAEGLAAFSERTLTQEGNLAFSGDSDNNVFIDALLYSFPIGEQTQIVVAANSGAADDFASTVNFLDGDGASGALSTFGTRPPIYYLAEGAGVGLRQQLGKKLELSLGYLAGDAANPAEGGGLFNGPYAGLAQLVIKPTEKLNIGLTYIHSYNNNDTGTGSNLANFQGGLTRYFDRDLQGTSVGDTIGSLGFSTALPVVSNSYGLELSWQLSDRFVVGGWAGYTNTRTLSTLGGLVNRGDVDIWNWAVTLGFPDLGKKGNLGGIIVGMEPKVTNSSLRLNPGALPQLTALGIPLPPVGKNNDTSLHVEAFYQYQLTDNISITPGVIWLTAPDHNNRNDDLVIGVVRTTFTF